MSRIVPASTGALVDSRGVRRGERNGPSHLEAADVAFEFGPGEPAAAPDVDGSQLAGLHEGVDGRSSDAEDVRSLLAAHQQASERLASAAESGAPTDAGAVADSTRALWRELKVSRPWHAHPPTSFSSDPYVRSNLESTNHIVSAPCT